MDPDLSARVGEVWQLEDSIELIVSGRWIQGRVNEVSWLTVVLWLEQNVFGSITRAAGRTDQVGESALACAERGSNPSYSTWKRLIP